VNYLPADRRPTTESINQEHTMFDRIELTYGVALFALRRGYAHNERRERGEGVISAAIAVLIMAFLGAAMWIAFNSIWDDSEQKIRDNVESIGDG
jgi:hypothetical protein